MSIEKIEYYYTKLTSKDIPEIEECYTGLQAIPIAPMRVHVYINCCVSLLNGIRRTIIDEMPGHAMDVPKDGYIYSENSDPMLLHNLINSRIGYIKLVPIIEDDVKEKIRLNLHVANNSTTPMNVYSGDLTYNSSEVKLSSPLFNPTYILCTLSSGKTLHIENIQIVNGFGRDVAKFSNVCNASHKHLDIPEHPIAEVMNGEHMASSGYIPSSQITRPKKHKLMFNIPACLGNTDEIKYILNSALKNIRIRLVRIDSSMLIAQKRGTVEYQVNRTSDIYQATLNIDQETLTIGNLIREYIYDLEPTIANLSVKTGHTNEDITINVGHRAEPTPLIKKAISNILIDLDKLSHNITKIEIKKFTMGDYLTQFNTNPKI